MATKVEMTSRRGRKKSELYDLENDPGERDDLAAARTAQVAEMRAQLRQRLLELGVPLPPSRSGLPRCPHCSWRERQRFWQEALSGQSVEGTTAPQDVDAETLQRLRELGYVD